MPKLDEGFEEVPLELDEGFEETSLDEGFKEIRDDKESRGFSEEKPSQAEAVARKVGQGLTAGWMDEAAAGLQAGMDVASSDKEIKDLPKLYQIYKDLQKEREQQVSEDFPKTALASEVAGSVALGFTPLGAANTVSKGAKLGALYGLGSSQADLTRPDAEQIRQAALDTTLGMGTGALGGALAEELTPMVSSGVASAGKKLTQEAEDTALNVLDPSKKVLSKELGGSSAEVGTRRGMGAKALESIELTGGPSSVRAKAIEKIDAIEDAKKPLIQEANDKLQSVLKSGKAEDISSVVGSESSLSTQLNRIKDNVINHKTSVSTNIDEVEGLSNRLNETIQRFAGKDNDIFALNEFKSALRKELGDAGFAKKAMDLPDDAEFLKRTYMAVNNRIEELANKVSPDLGTKIRKMNMEEHNLMGLRDVAFNAEVNAVKGGGVGTGAMVGAGATAGAIAAGPIGAVIGGGIGYGAKKGLERTGWGLEQLGEIATAKGLSKAGQGLESISEGIASPGIASIPGGAARSVVGSSISQTQEKPEKVSKDLYSASDDQLKRVADTLIQNTSSVIQGEELLKAIQSKSIKRKNEVLFTLLQNPNTRKLISLGK